MDTAIISEKTLYSNYKEHLLEGNKSACYKIIQQLIDNNTNILSIYLDYFQRSLYEIGELWEQNKISVAQEHLATSITANLMTLMYPTIFEAEKTGKKAIISCVANEYHQIGGKMVADIFEISGWDTYFLGANTPSGELIRYIEEKEPDLLALSLALHFNLPKLVEVINEVNQHFNELPVLVGGQAFRWGNYDLLQKFKNVQYIDSLENLQIFLC